MGDTRPGNVKGMMNLMVSKLYGYRWGVGRHFNHHPHFWALNLRGLPLMLVIDFFPVGDLSLVNPERESTLWVGACPGLERHGSSFLPIVG